MTSTKGFILISGNPVEALNKVALAISRLCSRHRPQTPDRHPFKLEDVSLSDYKCFNVTFTNKREIAGNYYRSLQIGVFEDQDNLVPVGTKISFSLGSWGDSEFVMKTCLAEACAALSVTDAWYQHSDYTDEFIKI